MKLEAIKTIGEIAVELPQAIPYFEEKGIDYCCGGSKSLEEACAKAGIKVEEVLRTLGGIASRGDGQGPSAWTDLGSLIQYLLDKHHAYTRDQLALCTKLGSKVLVVHGKQHPELAEINRIFNEMSEELQHHLMKEEQVAFPFLMDRGKEGERAALPFPYEAFQNGPQRVLMGDHEATGEQLAALRRITQGYNPPPGACVTFCAFYRGLKELEADLHQHIHLENNVLFPMAERITGTL